MPVSTQVSFFGKVPCALDYVRIQHVSSAGIACDRWLERGQQELARINASWPAASFRFLFPSPTGEVLIGVMAPSRDRAGRRFPATIYAAVPTALTLRVGLVPLLFSAFFSEVDNVVAECLGAGTEVLAARLSQVPLPNRQDIGTVDLRRQAQLSSQSLLDFAQANFVADLPSTRAALRRFGLAMPSAGMVKERAPVLCCPVREEPDVTAWLSLAEKRLGTAADGLWAFWTLQPSCPRLYLGQGEVPATLPVWLGGLRVKSERFCDLRPSDSEAKPEPSDVEATRCRGESSLSLEQAFDQIPVH